MAKARRKTTLEKRKEIVGHCISHDRDYKETASLYDVSFESKYMAIQYFTEKTMEHQLDVQADGNLTCSLLQMAEPLNS